MRRFSWKSMSWKGRSPTMSDRSLRRNSVATCGAESGDGAPWRLTAQMPGVGGVLKAAPADFVVEEIPSYEPSGEGEHVYLFIEKRDATTSRAVDELARRFGVSRKEIGVAGLKDRRAISRQWVSIYDPHHRLDEHEAAAIETEWLRVLEATRHGNKLRRGHLRENRFIITLRETGVVAVMRAAAILSEMQRRGAPNFFGPQRYGSRGVNHLIARSILLEDYGGAVTRLLGLTEPDDHTRADAEARRLFEAGRFEDALEVFPKSAIAERKALAALKRGGDPRAAIRAVPAGDREFWISAFQSAVFDDALRHRAERGALERLIPGDLAYKHMNGAVFAIGDDGETPELRERLENLEISPSGPLWGPRMMRAGGVVDEAERVALVGSGVTIDALIAFTKRTGNDGLGARRSYRAALLEPAVEAGVDERGEYLRLQFMLPPGAYATVVMDEVMKPEASNSQTGESGVRRPW